MALGPHFGHVFGIVVAWWSPFAAHAVNTGGRMIGLMYMLARDREMPRPFAKLNSHGVPEPCWWQPSCNYSGHPGGRFGFPGHMYALVSSARLRQSGFKLLQQAAELNWRELQSW